MISYEHLYPFIVIFSLLYALFYLLINNLLPTFMFVPGHDLIISGGYPVDRQRIHPTPL